MTVNLTGQTSVSGKGVTTAPVGPEATPSTTCAELAQGEEGELPLGEQVAIGQDTVKWDMTVTSYRGAGTYHPIDIDLTVGGRGYFAETSRQVGVEVSSEFSTKLTFSDLVEDGVGPAKISGTISWTCVNAKH